MEKEMTATDFAREYYQLEKSGITTVRVLSAITFAERFATLKQIEENKSILKMAEIHMDERAVFVLKDRIRTLENSITPPQPK